MTALTVISAQPEPIGARVRRLQNEARSAAASHVGELEGMLEQTAQLCADIATGGDSYPPGIREKCARMAVDAVASLHTIRSINARLAR